MRVSEFNRCGETLSATDDDELAHRLEAHFESEHAGELSHEKLREFLAAAAYDATDS